MAIDDNTSYELTGAQVKDLAQRIKSGGGGGSNAVILYSSVSFHTPIQLADIYSDAALTTSVTGATVKGYIEAGKTVAIIYETSVSDVPQNETLIITSCDNHSEATHGVIVFTGTFFDYSNSEPVLYTLACDQPSNLWSASQKSIPTKTSDITNDGDDGVHPFLATDDVATVATTGAYSDLSGTPSLATVATSGSYDDLSNKPTIPAAQVNSDWNASSGVSQILNRPTVRHVSSVSDAGWSGAEYHLIDGSALAYWNGAYSGTASNLKYFANSSVTTANLQNDCVTASKLYDRNTANTTDTWLLVLNGDKIQHRVVKTFNSDGSIPKSAMHGIPAPDPSSVITNWGSISASGNNEKTMSADGFVVGKGCTFGADQSALVKLNGQEVGGVSYTTFSGYMQVAYCFPVRSGDKVQFYLNKSGPQHQGCKLIGWKM